PPSRSHRRHSRGPRKTPPARWHTGQPICIPTARMSETTTLQAPVRPQPPLPDATDWLRIAALTVVGMGLRLLYFIGYGLGDDIVLRNFINILLQQGQVLHDNLAYRVVWWLPTATSSRTG